MDDQLLQLARVKTANHMEDDRTHRRRNVPPGASLGPLAAEHADSHALDRPGHVHPPLGSDELGLIVDALHVLAATNQGLPIQHEIDELGTRMHLEHQALREDRRRL
jgi:hypothetical protein